jgi:Uncharacterised protein family (UPF0158)
VFGAPSSAIGIVGDRQDTTGHARCQCVVGGRTEQGWHSFSHETTHATYAELVLDLGKLDVDEIAMALSDQSDYEHRWLIDPRTGEIAFWTSDTGIDGENPVDLDELDLIPIDPLPSWVWYADMADFAEEVSDDAAGRRLGQALRGRGAFRRFKHELLEEHPDLVSAWHAFRDARANRRAVEWLFGQGLIRDDAARKSLVDHPDPDLP